MRIAIIPPSLISLHIIIIIIIIDNIKSVLPDMLYDCKQECLYRLAQERHCTTVLLCTILGGVVQTPLPLDICFPNYSQMLSTQRLLKALWNFSLQERRGDKGKVV